MKARALIFGVLLLLTACAPHDESPGALATVISQAEIAARFPAVRAPIPCFGAVSYHLVARDWLVKKVYPAYVSELFDVGLIKDGRPRYDERAQCNYFADKLVTVAQERFFNDLFHSFEVTESPAVGVIWYRRLDGQLHAINFAILEDQSLVFFEPQAAQYTEVHLSDTEVKSIYLIKL